MSSAAGSAATGHADGAATAALLLRLVLGRAEEADERVDWEALLPIALRNRVALRVAEALLRRGDRLPPATEEAIRRERLRRDELLELMQRVSASCAAQPVSCMFIKALQHYPDVGGDLDLLVLSSDTRIDARLLAGLGAVELPGGLRGRLAGVRRYRVGGYAAPLDLMHGRLGPLGEETAFPHLLIANRRRVLRDGAVLDVPSLEDQLLLQGMQRVYGQRRMHVADVAFTLSALRKGTLDWSYVLETASRLGFLPGLSCYLSFVAQAHADAFGAGVVVPAADRLLRDDWGRIEFRGGSYRFPALRVNARLYARRFTSGVASERWETVGRLGLAPVVAAAALVRRRVMATADGSPP